MKFAIKISLRTDDPTAGIERLKPPKTTGFHSWTDAEIAQYEATHPIGSQARLGWYCCLYGAASQ